MVSLIVAFPPFSLELVGYPMINLPSASVNLVHPAGQLARLKAIIAQAGMIEFCWVCNLESPSMRSFRICELSWLLLDVDLSFWKSGVPSVLR